MEVRVQGRTGPVVKNVDEVLQQHVSSTAREGGFRCPVAVTAAAWGECVTVPPGVACQDEAGRLWGVLWSAIR
jgi:hypothetical protein